MSDVDTQPQADSAGAERPEAEEPEGPGKLADACRIIMGLVFLIAGAAKVWEPVAFFWDAVSFAQLAGLGDGFLPARAALYLVPLECGLGVALLTNWRSAWVLPSATALMGLFLGLTLRAWSTGVPVDCGCFGSLIERDPGEALVEDTIMLVLLLTAWTMVRGSSPGTPLRGARWFVLGATILGAVIGFGRLSMDTMVYPLVPGTPFPELRGAEDLELESGEHLVIVLHPNCKHCNENLTQFNAWAGAEGLPPVVALNPMTPDSAELKAFQAKAKFPIETISIADWRRLGWNMGLPRAVYLRDGMVRATWEHNEIPSVGELRRTGRGD